MVSGLQNSDQASVAVADFTASTTQNVVTGNGSSLFVLRTNDQYAVTASSAGYTVSTSTACAGTLAANATCLVAFSIANSSGTGSGLGITKTVDNSNPKEGDTVHYVITVSALGPASSTGVVATDTLPTGLTFVNATTSLGAYASSTGGWTIGTLGANASAVLTLDARVNSSTAGTVILNTASATQASGTSNVSASVAITVQSSTSSSTPRAASITLSANPSAILLGSSSTLAWSSSFATNCQASGDWTGSRAASGTEIVTPATTGTKTYVLSCASIDAGGASSTASTTIFVGTANQADVAITKTVDNANPSANATIHYVLTVSAQGPATSTGVVATDTLPSGLTFVNATTSLGAYASSTGGWTIGDLSPSSTATLMIAATVNSSTAGQTITNIGTVAENASTTDQNPANNSSSVSIVIQSNGGGGGGTSTPNAGLTITKTVDNATPKEGATIHYVLTVSAQGPATSTGVVATDTLPSGLTFVNATTSLGAYASSTGGWTIGDLSPSSTATLMIAATVNSSTAGQTITNIGTVVESSTVNNPNPNTSSSVPITVQTPPCTSNCGDGGGGGGGGGGGIVIVGGGGSAYSIAINNGASSTPTVNVMLSLYGTNAYRMEISNYPDFSSSTGWIAYVNQMPWVLISGSGQRTVYARYRSVTGADLATVSASIDLLGGQVIGASSTCGIYLNDYIHPIRKYLNKPIEVEKLQIFLNENLGLNLPINGVYDNPTIQAVDTFQVKYHGHVLAPWVPFGLPTEMTPTGYVYKTTRWWINNLVCASLNLPMPVLP